jgi:hypothetical protein
MKKYYKASLIFLLMTLFINALWSVAAGNDHEPNPPIHDLIFSSDVAIPDLLSLHSNNDFAPDMDKEPAKDTIAHKPGHTRDVIAGYNGWAGNPDSLAVYIDDTWTAAKKDTLRAAMARWNNAGSVPKFKEVTKAADAKITITQGDPGAGNAGLYSGNTDADGKVTGGTITIAEDTSPLSLKEVATHELGHAIGLDDTDQAANAGDVMKGSGPSNGSNGNLSKHDSTEMRQAGAAITALAEAPKERRRAISPEQAIMPGQFEELIFPLSDFFLFTMELIVEPIADDLCFVEYFFIEGDQLHVGLFTDPMHGSGKLYLDVSFITPDGIPVEFWGVHFINIFPVPPIEFSCPFEVIQSGDLVHVNWVDLCTYPSTNPLHSRLIVDGNTYFEVKPNGDYAIKLEQGPHTLDLFVDDFQINSASYSMDIFVEFIQECPTVDAGSDATVNAGEAYFLTDAEASNYGSLLWLTSGDGFFDDPTSLSTIYSPGEGDIASGAANLCLYALPIPPCPNSAIDCMTLTIESFNPTTPPWEEPFEGYPVGSDIVGQGGWEFWFGVPISPGARVTNDQAHSGGQSLKIMGAEDAALADDILHQFSGCNSGVWKFSTWQFIPAAAAGGTTYITLLDQYGNDIDECHWATQIKFDPDLGVVESEIDGATLPLVKGQWVGIDIIIDFDNDWQTISYNGQILTQKSWTLGVPQEMPGILNLAAIDLFANTLANTPVYYDDFVITNEFENFPIIVCPPEITVSNNPGLCGAAGVDLGFPEIINPDGTEVITNNAPDVFPVGVTTVIWIVTNSGGYTVSCDQVVSVLDEEPPFILPMPDLEAPNDPGQCGAALTWEWPIPEDNCGIESVTGNYEPGATFPVGLTDVVYTANDFSGNQSYDGFTVTVLDTEGPQFEAELPDLEAPNDPGQCGAALTWEWPIPEDNCGIESVTGNYEPGATFPVGLTDVVYTATDFSGNQNYDGFTVTVLDVEGPEFPEMPDLQAPNDPGQCGAALTWEWPIPEDNCGIESLTGNYEPRMFFPVGLTDVVYTSTDVSGNQAYAGFTVTVFDTDPPDVSCAGDMTVSQSFPPFTLSGATPEGGIYEGPGVSGGIFFPADAGVGTHQINYMYANPSSGCTYGCGFSISVTGGAAQTIQIPQGWSGLSSYIQPEPPLIDLVLSPIFDQLVMLYNFDGMFYPGQNINTLGEWDVHEGYVIKVTDDVLLTINGDETPDKSVFLNEGWSIIPVLSSNPIFAETLFGGLDQLIIVKEVAGNGIYWPQFGINTLSFVEPGKSYFVLMNASAWINFGTSSTKFQYEGKPSEIINSPWNAVVPGPASHVVAFRLAENVFQNGDIVGGFNTDGACTGLVQITDSNTPFALSVFGNTQFSRLSDGLESGEAISYKLYRPSTNETFMLEVRYNEAMNTGHFENNGLSEVKSVKLAPVGVLDFQTLKVSIYPNPSDGTFTVNGNGEQVELNIFNAFGEQVYASEAVLPHKIILGDHPAGIYFIKVTRAKGGYYGKVIIK